MNKLNIKSKSIGVTEYMEEYAIKKLSKIKSEIGYLDISLCSSKTKFKITFETPQIRITKKGDDFYDLITKISKVAVQKEQEKEEKIKSKKIKENKKTKVETATNILEENLTDEIRPEGSPNKTSQELYEEQVQNENEKQTETLEEKIAEENTLKQEETLEQEVLEENDKNQETDTPIVEEEKHITQDFSEQPKEENSVQETSEELKETEEEENTREPKEIEEILI